MTNLTADETLCKWKLSYNNTQNIHYVLNTCQQTANNRTE